MGTDNADLTDESPVVMVAGIHSSFHELLYNYINDHTRYCTVAFGSHAGEFGDPLAYLSSIPNLAALFISYDLENRHGDELLRRIKKNFPALAAIGFSHRCSEIKVLRMLEAGARAFINYDCAVDETELLLDTVIAGRYYFNQCLSSELLGHWHTVRHFEDAPYKLRFDREQSQLVSLIHEGKIHDEIARLTQKSKKTVDNAVSFLLTKTHCRNSHELVSYAIRNEEI